MIFSCRILLGPELWQMLLWILSSRKRWKRLLSQRWPSSSLCYSSRLEPHCPKVSHTVILHADVRNWSLVSVCWQQHQSSLVPAVFVHGRKANLVQDRMGMYWCIEEGWQTTLHPTILQSLHVMLDLEVLYTAPCAQPIHAVFQVSSPWHWHVRGSDYSFRPFVSQGNWFHQEPVSVDIGSWFSTLFMGWDLPILTLHMVETSMWNTSNLQCIINSKIESNNPRAIGPGQTTSN